VTTNSTGLAFGNSLRDELLAKGKALGIQQIIFTNGSSTNPFDLSWRPGRVNSVPLKINLHRNHLHIEINKAVSQTPVADAVRFIQGILG
jgi:hypothetical protein